MTTNGGLQHDYNVEALGNCDFTDDSGGGSMSACAMGGKTSWKEEVLLHDGMKLIVERSQTYGGYAEPASTDRSVAKEEWVFRIPGSDQQVTWKSDFSRPPEVTA
jgi:hypothetical protein